MTNFNWTCPHGERAVTITHERQSIDTHTVHHSNSMGQTTLRTVFLVCPNPECTRFTLNATLHSSKYTESTLSLGAPKQSWRLIPDSKGKSFPDYIPEAIR